MNKLGYKKINISPILVKKMCTFIRNKLKSHKETKIQNDKYFHKFFSNKIQRAFSVEIEILALKEAYRIAYKYFQMIGTIPYVDKSLIKKCGYPKLDLFFRLVRKNKASDIGFPHTDKFFWMIAKKNKITPPFSNCKKRIKIWIPLIGCNKTNSLLVYPKSHLTKNYYEVKKNINNLRPKTKQKIDNFKSVSPVFCQKNKYEALMFEDNLIHAGQINKSSNLRISAEFHIIMEK